MKANRGRRHLSESTKDGDNALKMNENLSERIGRGRGKHDFHYRTHPPQVKKNPGIREYFKPVDAKYSWMEKPEVPHISEILSSSRHASSALHSQTDSAAQQYVQMPWSSTSTVERDTRATPKGQSSGWDDAVTSSPKADSRTSAFASSNDWDNSGSWQNSKSKNSWEINPDDSWDNTDRNVQYHTENHSADNTSDPSAEEKPIPAGDSNWNECTIDTNWETAPIVSDNPLPWEVTDEGHSGQDFGENTLENPFGFDSDLVNSDSFGESTTNKVDGPWESKDLYLRNHYMLLREDSLRSLREAVEMFLSMPEMTEESKSQRKTMGIYEAVKVCGVTLSYRGPAVRVTFSTRRIGKNVRWEQSKRLLAGSLVVLISASNVNDCKVATVAARPISLVTKNPPEVDLLFHDPSDFELDCSKEYVMVEDRSGYYESERYTMLALQKMIDEPFPFLDHLVSLKQDVDAPEYLSHRPCLNIRSLLSDADQLSEQYSSVNVLQSWPEKLPTSLDHSQEDAVKRIITKRLAVVQGPPGTGKTYVSVQAAKVLLKNMRPSDPPIIVACQTNHALDQILRHINEFEQRFIRLGGRSKDKEIVAKHTLAELRNDDPSLPASRVPRALEDVIKKLKIIMTPLGANADVLSPQSLKEKKIITEKQFESLKSGVAAFVDTDSCSELENSLAIWIGKSLKKGGYEPPQQHWGFAEFEDDDYENEAVAETDAEQVMVGEGDEFEMLRGDFMEISDSWTATGTGRVSLAEARLSKESNLWKIKPQERGIIFRYFLRKYKEKILEEVRENLGAYQNAVKERTISRWEVDEAVMRKFRVIGLTTTGIAKYRGLISGLRPRICIVEEAAETLEAPVAAACVPSLQHMILVGDHAQLRPQCHVPRLEGPPYNLNVSMFERMVNNGVEFSRLVQQRRMRPQISRVLEPIYGNDIKDHESVKKMAKIPGLKMTNWFYSHEFLEAKDAEASTYNSEEAAMILKFIKYLHHNGVPIECITVLTFYNGQRRELRRQSRASDMANQLLTLKIPTVDSYQGEENEIVILSLVRSNEQGNIGFLSVTNRVCVAISRAKQGFFMFGNAQLLAVENSLWSSIIRIMCGINTDEPRRLGFSIPITCRRHNRKLWMREPADWKGIVGGCDVKCIGSLPCGHSCPYNCHPFVHEDVRCDQACHRIVETCGHRCAGLCYEPCMCSRCTEQTLKDRGREGQLDGSYGNLSGFKSSFVNEPYDNKLTGRDAPDLTWADGNKKRGEQNYQREPVTLRRRNSERSLMD